MASMFIYANGKTIYANSKTLSGVGDSLVCTVGDTRIDCEIIDFAAVEASVAFQDKTGRWQISWPGAQVAMEIDSDCHDFVADSEGAVVTINGVGHRIEKGIDCHGGANTLCVEWRKGVAEIFVCGRKSTHVASMTLPMPTEGFTVSATTAATVESAAMEIDGRQTPYSSVNPLQALSEKRQTSPVEGFWKYLDRETDPALAVNGGSYTLAIVGNADGGFDLIYMEGASTNAAEWKQGMLKGRLTDLGFDDHFRLEWFDAMHRPMGAECYARMESAEVITFNFPLYGASLRFQRVHSTM